MMEHREDFHHDLLDRAVEAVLREPAPEAVPPDKVAQLAAVVRQAAKQTDRITLLERIRGMKRIVKLTVAASILAVVGSVASWIVLGGSGNMAFARVAEALDSLRSATFDIAINAEAPGNQPAATATAKGFFLAPSRQRFETSAGPNKTLAMITICDGQAGKALMLMPEQKFAMAMDMKKIQADMQKSARGAPADLFETVRRLVREGSSGTGEAVERLGKKDLDGRKAVGFRLHQNVGEMSIWADAATARPMRIELSGEMFTNVHLVMENFRYDIDVDPALFGLEPPAGYSTQTMSMALPTEEDLLRTLRTVAEHNKGLFPTRLAMTKELMDIMTALIKPEIEKLAAKHGQVKPGEKPTPEAMTEFMKAVMPRMQKEMQGIAFYAGLTTANDPHYAGNGVKLGTPERPIVWYKPTGSEKYRVIYADLSVKEVSADQAPKMPASNDASKTPQKTP